MFSHTSFYYVYVLNITSNSSYRLFPGNRNVNWNLNVQSAAPLGLSAL